MGTRRHWHGGIRLNVRASDDAVTIALSGELDLHAAERLERVWKPLIDRDAIGKLVLDLRGLRFIDSSGLALVLAIHRDCQGTGRRFAVLRPPDVVLHRFEAAGVAEHLPLVDELDCRSPGWTNG